MFFRAEREGDWLAISSWSFQPDDTILLRCWPCALYTQWVLYLRNIWNGIWSDAYIQTTFMGYGCGQCGIIGIILKPETRKMLTVEINISCNSHINVITTTPSLKTVYKTCTACIITNSGYEDCLQTAINWLEIQIKLIQTWHCFQNVCQKSSQMTIIMEISWKNGVQYRSLPLWHDFKGASMV